MQNQSQITDDSHEERWRERELRAHNESAIPNQASSRRGDATRTVQSQVHRYMIVEWKSL